MSTTIDQKVVEMRFDNKQFEQATAESMSTLEKLKQKLNLTSSAKGLENISAAANKVDMSGLGTSVETISARFSAMQVVGVTALANITNSAVNAGKRIVKALTIDPVTTGFQEYETKINAVQTIMSNTASKGTTMADVTRVLDELNTYADKTIYNFAEMTRNIGTFTAAGVGLEDSASAIQGIANLAAMSGSTSQQAATAMYQLSQALAAGTVKLMDWNSVVNAGMGGQKFQDALKQTAREMGIKVDDMIKKAGSFRESLQKGWITADVLNTTLKKLTVEGAEDYAKAMLKSGKYTKAQADALIKEAKMAEDAATKVKTFTQLWDTTKEAVQSGWAKTWEIIIGDFEESKNLLTPISDFLTKIIDKFSEARNKLLESALGKGFTSLSKRLNKALGPVDKITKGMNTVSKTSSKVNKTIASLGKTVDDVILGKFGNGKERFDKLTKAGQNFYRVQNQVNKKLGDSKRYTKEQIKNQDKILKKQAALDKANKNNTKSSNILSKAQKKQLKSLMKLSDEQLKAKGYTDDQIDAFNELVDTADKLGLPIDTFIDKMDKLNGRFLLINSFKNIGKAIGDVFSSIGKAYGNVFDSIKPKSLFDAIVAFHKFTSEMRLSKDTIDKLARTLQGLFSIVKLITTVFGGGFRIVFTIIQSLLDGLGIGILDLTATIGDAVTKVVDWFENNIVLKALGAIVEKIPTVIDKIKEFFSELDIGEDSSESFKTIMEGIGAAFEVLHSKISLSLPFVIKVIGEVLKLMGTSVSEVAEKIANAIKSFRKWLNENTIFIDSVDKIAAIIERIIDIISTLAKKIFELQPVKDFIDNILDAFKGLGDMSADFTFLDNVFTALSTIEANLTNWLETLKNSTNIGEDLIKGLSNGITGAASMLYDAVVGIAKGVIELFKDIFGIHSPSVVMMAIGSYLILGLLLGMKNLFPKVFGYMQEGVEGMVSVLEDIFNGGLPKIYESLKVVFGKIVESFKELDISIGSIFVAGTIVASLLLIKKALDIAAAFAKPIEGVNKILGAFKDLLGSAKKYIDNKTLETKSIAILNFAKAIFVLTASIVILSKISVQDLAKAGVALFALVGIITLLLKVASKAEEAKDVSFLKLSVLLISLSLSLTIMSSAMKKMAEIPWQKSLVACGELVVLIAALGGVLAAYGKFVKGKSAQNIGAASKIILQMGIAIGILALTMKLVAGMSWAEIGKASAVVGGLMLLSTIAMILTRFAGSQSKLLKAGAFFLAMGVSIRLMVGVIKKISKISKGDIDKGTDTLLGVMSLFILMLVLSEFAGDNAAQAGVLFLGMAVAVAILVRTIKSIADIKGTSLLKGLIIVGVITAVFAAIMYLAEFAGDNAAQAGFMFLAMASSIAILGFTIKLIGGIKVEDAIQGLVAIGIMLHLFSKTITAVGKKGKNGDKVGKMFLKMAVAIGILAGAIAILSLIEPKDLIAPGLCVAGLLYMFERLMKASEHVKGGHKTIMMIAITIGTLAAAITALSFLEPSKLVTATMCMSALMGMFALIMKSTPTVKSATSTLIVITVAIGMIAGALYLVGQLDTVTALGSAISLSLVLLAVTKSLQILNTVKTITPNALIALGIISTIMIVLGGILGVMEHFNILPSLVSAAALSLLLISLATVCEILSTIGLAGVAAIQGALALDAVILVLGLLIVSIGGLFQAITGMEGMLDKGIAILGKIGEGIGLFVGKLIGGIAEGVTSVLPAIGKSLGDFMTNAKPFFDGLNGIDPKVGETAKSLALAILALSAAEMLDAMNIFGGVDMTKFGNQLVGLGMAMRAYSLTVQGIDSESILNSAKAAKALVEVVNALPKEGGLWQKITGVEDLNSLSTKLGAFGTAMKSYGTSVAEIDCEAIKNSAQGAKALVEVLNALPKEGGLWQKITGVEDLNSLSGKLTAFGDGMKSYADKVTGIDNEAVSASAKGAEGLAKAIDALPESDGWLQKLGGNKDIKGFADSLADIGGGMKAYSDSVAGINPEAVSSSATAAKKLAETMKSASGIEFSNVTKFTKAINKLAKANIDGVTKAFSGAQNAAKLVTAGVNMVKSVGKGINSSKKSVTSAATSINSAVHKALSSTKGFSRAGIALVSAFSKGLKNKSEEVKKAGKSISSKAVSGAKDKNNKTSMESAGKDLGNGLVNGIKAKKDAAYKAGLALGKAAVRGEKDGQESNSPSKATKKAGKWLGEGLIIGIESMSRKVENAGYSMGEESINYISKAISDIGSIIDSDMDVQPTIAPVMDLSDVESGVGAINGMFGRSFGISAAADLNAINIGMSRLNQNGRNDDVISAINGLKKSISEMSGDTYSINGVTYDDGSNISEAVRTLVRAARVERRV